MIIDKIRRKARQLTQPMLWRLYKGYLSRTRWFSYQGLSIKVAPSVFHPGLLFSTKILARFVLQFDLKDQRVLELGAGSGMISSLVCRAGAKVLATDINPMAIESMLATKTANTLDFEVLESDLFEQVAATLFDYVLINPPYFPQKANTDREKAFFCGSNFEYFHRLFAQLPHYITPKTAVFMILSDDCAIDTIQEISNKENFNWQLVHEQKIWGEINFIYKITLK